MKGREWCLDLEVVGRKGDMAEVETCLDDSYFVVDTLSIIDEATRGDLVQRTRRRRSSVVSDSTQSMRTVVREIRIGGRLIADWFTEAGTSAFGPASFVRLTKKETVKPGEIISIKVEFLEDAAWDCAVIGLAFLERNVVVAQGE